MISKRRLVKQEVRAPTRSATSVRCLKKKKVVMEAMAMAATAVVATVTTMLEPTCPAGDATDPGT